MILVLCYHFVCSGWVLCIIPYMSSWVVCCFSFFWVLCVHLNWKFSSHFIFFLWNAQHSFSNFWLHSKSCAYSLCLTCPRTQTFIIASSSLILIHASAGCAHVHTVDKYLWIPIPFFSRLRQSFWWESLWQFDGDRRWQWKFSNMKTKTVRVLILHCTILSFSNWMLHISARTRI